MCWCGPVIPMGGSRVRSFRILEVHWPRMVQRIPGYTVGTLGAYWTIQRLAILLAAAR